MFEHLWGSCGDRRVKQRQMHGHIRIGMRYFHEYIPHGDHDRQFFLTFTDQRLRPGFARLHLAANKFPQQPTRLMRRTLADQETALLPDQRSDDFGHVVSLPLHPV